MLHLTFGKCSPASGAFSRTEVKWTFLWWRWACDVTVGSKTVLSPLPYSEKCVHFSENFRNPQASSFHLLDKSEKSQHQQAAVSVNRLEDCFYKNVFCNPFIFVWKGYTYYNLGFILIASNNKGWHKKKNLNENTTTHERHITKVWCKMLEVSISCVCLSMQDLDYMLISYSAAPSLSVINWTYTSKQIFHLFTSPAPQYIFNDRCPPVFLSQLLERDICWVSWGS